MSRSLGPIERRLAEAEARAGKVEVSAGGSTAPDFSDPNFPVQQAVLDDEAKLITVLCTRRSAKTFTAAKRLLRAMFKYPGASCLFIGLTDESAMRAIWKDVLKVIDRRWKLGATFSETRQVMRLPNGSELIVLGMDRDESERDKLLGGKYAEVAIDECASFNTDLFELVFTVLSPAVADYRGAIVLCGTPGNVKVGLFFELTKGHDPQTPHRWKKDGWSGHCWNTFVNPYMVEEWKAKIAELKEAMPNIESTPSYQQMYLGRWVIDDSLLVYKYLPGRNGFDGKLAEVPTGRWHYVLAVDTGWKASAFSLVAYHDHQPNLFVLESWKRRGMIISDLSAVIHAYEKRVSLDTTVIDGANKQAVEEINRRHRVSMQPIEAAEKRDKFQFIDLLNDDLILSRVRVSNAEWELATLSSAGPIGGFMDAGRQGTPDYTTKHACGLLVSELAVLVINEEVLKKKRKREEHPNCENHCADTLLYAWRHCYQYLSEPLPPPAPKVNTPEYYAAEQAKLDASFEEQMERNRGEHDGQSPLDWL